MSSYEISCKARPSLRSVLQFVGISSAIVRLFCEMNDSFPPPAVPFIYSRKSNRRRILRRSHAFGFSSPPQLVLPNDYGYRKDGHPYRKYIPSGLYRSLPLLLFPSLSSNVPAFREQSNSVAKNWNYFHLLNNPFLKFADEWTILPCFPSTRFSFYLKIMNLTDIGHETSVLVQEMALNSFQIVSFSSILICENYLK